MTNQCSINPACSKCKSEVSGVDENGLGCQFSIFTCDSFVRSEFAKRDARIKELDCIVDELLCLLALEDSLDSDEQALSRMFLVLNKMNDKYKTLGKGGL